MASYDEYLEMNEYDDDDNNNDDDDDDDDDDDVDEPCEEEIAGIITMAMKEQNIYPTNIPAETEPFSLQRAKNSKRYFETRGFAWFCCPKRHDHHSWCSPHAWCYLDLKRRNISYRDQQNCRMGGCENPVSPEFTREAVESMASYAVREFLKRTGRRVRGRGNKFRGEPVNQTSGGPHEQSRCGKCKRIGRPCWK